MSKERLEKAKKILNHIKGYGVYDGNDDIEIFEWFIKQAERVEELEEALGFYADENNYREQELKGIVPPRPITFKPILHDYGSIARQALEGRE